MLQEVEEAMISTKKHGMDVYMYFRRNGDIIEQINQINGKTWSEAAKLLGAPIPRLFTFLEHAKRVGIVKEVKIK